MTVTLSRTIRESAELGWCVHAHAGVQLLLAVLGLQRRNQRVLLRTCHGGGLEHGFHCLLRSWRNTCYDQEPGGDGLHFVAYK